MSQKLLEEVKKVVVLESKSAKAKESKKPKRVKIPRRIPEPPLQGTTIKYRIVENAICTSNRWKRPKLVGVDCPKCSRQSMCNQLKEYLESLR